MPTTVRPNVVRMHPYQPGKPIATVQRELGLKQVVKMASNENPFGPSPKAVEAVQMAVGEMNLYPDGAAFELRNALAVRYGIPLSQVIVGHGSDELIGNLALAFIEDPYDEILTSEFSFPRYDAAAEMAPCKLIKAPMRLGYRFDLNALLSEINEKTKLIYLANPNNPTGTIVTRDEMNEFVEALPSHVLLVVDEAYFEFARRQVDYPDARQYVLAGKNVVSLRTFSKAHGIAGIRVGYGFAPEYVARALDQVQAPFHLNSLAQVAGLAALGDDAHVRKTLDNNSEWLSMLALAFAREGCDVTESHTNFHFVDLKRTAAPIVDGLLKKGYIVRPIPGAPNHIRVTVGTPDENQGFIDAFRAAMAFG